MKVYGKRSSRKPTSLENLFRTRPALDTVRHWITDRLIERLPETDRQTDRHTDLPIGLVSKKSMGVRRTAANILLCRTLEAFTQRKKKVMVRAKLIKMAAAVAPP